jgi:hypothetical protein
VAALVKPCILPSAPRALLVSVELWGRHDGSGSPALGWWLPKPWSSLAPHDLLSVVTSLGYTPDPACALEAGEARGWTTPPLSL